MTRLYKAMCHHLLGVIADARKLLENEDYEAAKRLLDKARQDAEEFAEHGAEAEETPT